MEVLCSAEMLSVKWRPLLSEEVDELEFQLGEVRGKGEDSTHPFYQSSLYQLYQIFLFGVFLSCLLRLLSFMSASVCVINHETARLTVCS
jgi:hypothetical protein